MANILCRRPEGRFGHLESGHPRVHRRAIIDALLQSISMARPVRTGTDAEDLPELSRELRRLRPPDRRSDRRDRRFRPGEQGRRVLGAGTMEVGDRGRAHPVAEQARQVKRPDERCLGQLPQRPGPCQVPVDGVQRGSNRGGRRTGSSKHRDIRGCDGRPGHDVEGDDQVAEVFERAFASRVPRFGWPPIRPCMPGMSSRRAMRAPAGAAGPRSHSRTGPTGGRPAAPIATRGPRVPPGSSSCTRPPLGMNGTNARSRAPRK